MLQYYYMHADITQENNLTYSVASRLVGRDSPWIDLDRTGKANLRHNCDKRLGNQDAYKKI